MLPNLRPVRLVAIAVSSAALASCGAGGPGLRSAVGSASPSVSSSVPPEFAAACGHPDASVMFTGPRITVRHVDCDLAGVEIDAPWAGATVPESDSVINSIGLEIDVATGTGDVTVISDYRPGALPPQL